MRCLKCNRTIRNPKGKTKETQTCGTCRGIRNKQHSNNYGRMSHA